MIKKKLPQPVFFVIIVCFGINLVYGASLTTIEVPSAAMKKDVSVSVIVPDAYSKHGDRRFPVLYLLHGAGDTNEKWPRSTPIQALSDTYNIVVVCPDAGRTSWYFDSPEDPTYQYETFVSAELVQFIDRHYRTLASRQYRAITGNSMGGHGAMFLAIRHKDLFGVVGCLSGGVDIRPFAEQWDIKKRLGPIASHRDRWEALTVINLAKRLKDGDLAISIDCGTDDFFIGVNRNLHRQLLDDNISHVYIERPGGHSWDYWSNAIKYQMLFFSECFNEVNR